MTIVPGAEAPSTIGTRLGELAYRIDGVGTPLLLLQRFRGTIDDWDPDFIRGLTEAGRQVIRFDNLGIGRSGGVTPGSVVEWADAALAFADALGLARFDLLGWSMGGMVAQWLALKAPDRLNHLILAATSPGCVTETVMDDPNVLEIRKKQDPTEDDYLYLFYSHDEDGRRIGRASLQRTAAQSTGPGVTSQASAAQMQAAKNFNGGRDATRGHLAELSVRTLVANGNADVMQPPIGSFIIAQGAPNAKLVLYPHSGHAFLFQHADAFLHETCRFLNG